MSSLFYNLYYTSIQFRFRFSRDCYLDQQDNQVTCRCPMGYQGRRCEECSSGYSGNPLIPGQDCRPGKSVFRIRAKCDPFLFYFTHFDQILRCVMGRYIPMSFRVFRVCLKKLSLKKYVCIQGGV